MRFINMLVLPPHSPSYCFWSSLCSLGWGVWISSWLDCDDMYAVVTCMPFPVMWPQVQCWCPIPREPALALRVPLLWAPHPLTCCNPGHCPALTALHCGYFLYQTVIFLRSTPCFTHLHSSSIVFSFVRKCSLHPCHPCSPTWLQSSCGLANPSCYNREHLTCSFSSLKFQNPGEDFWLFSHGSGPPPLWTQLLPMGVVCFHGLTFVVKCPYSQGICHCQQGGIYTIKTGPVEICWLQWRKKMNRECIQLQC